MLLVDGILMLGLALIWKREDHFNLLLKVGFLAVGVLSVVTYVRALP